MNPIRLLNALRTLALALLALPVPGLAAAGGGALLPIETQATFSWATNQGVRLHYAALGEGPLVVMLHGFPDCWLTWRNQMPALARTHRVIAPDLRGFNLSDRPVGDEAYDMTVLISDVAAIIRARSSAPSS